MSATHALHIAGAETVAAAGRTYETLNPFTGRPWARVADGGADDVDAAVRGNSRPRWPQGARWSSSRPATRP
jgi:acyl-CoA reductase-like NAD-dependent aldehyde dehydrogenase